MTTSHKLIVAGCSLGDRGNANICYGDVLSEILDAEYIHESYGCGSNYRIWRTVTNMILDGNISTDDTVVIQYTTTNRREFWTSNYVEPSDMAYDSAETAKHNTGIVQLVEEYKDFGYVVKYKSRSYLWQTNKDTSKFFKQYQEQFVNTEYDADMFRVNHYNFSNMLRANNIRVVFLSMFGYSGVSMIEPYSAGYPVLRINNDQLQDEHIQEDGTHLTDAGHTHVAGLIADYLKGLQ